MTKYISVYVHWPFCESKCPYCDFNSHVLRSISEEAWLEGIIHELNRYRELVGSRVLKSVFFGGGTPSLMHPKSVEKIITTLQNLFDFQSPEITLEANPNSVEAERFKDYASFGVNRLSLGIQALNDKDLKALGRKHSVKEALTALEIAQNTFKRISFDLIYARPHQTINEWEDELKYALSFKTDHLSLYQLTIEPGTAFAPMHARGDLVIPEEDLAYDLFKLTQELTQEAGLHAYEVSNHALKGFESQHNLTYWNYEEYIGVGPGAHGRILINNLKYATQQIRAPQLWIKSLQDKKNGDEKILSLTLDEQFSEQLMMGLRLYQGIKKDSLVRDFLDCEKMRLNELIKQNLVDDTSSTLKVKPEGMIVLNSLLSYLV